MDIYLTAVRTMFLFLLAFQTYLLLFINVNNPKLEAAIRFEMGTIFVLGIAGLFTSMWLFFFVYLVVFFLTLVFQTSKGKGYIFFYLMTLLLNIVLIVSNL